MRVIIAQDARPSFPLGLVGSDECGWVDFEMGGGVGVDVGGGVRMRDPTALPQQQPTAFVGVGFGGLGEDGVEARVRYQDHEFPLSSFPRMRESRFIKPTNRKEAGPRLRGGDELS